MRARALVMAASAWSCFMMAVFISSEELGAAELLPPNRDDIVEGVCVGEKEKLETVV